MKDCPICRHGGPLDIIGDLPSVWVTAGPVAPLPGYVCVVAKRHADEPYELPREELAAFWDESMSVARAVASLVRPKKMNYEIHGNTLPHLHLHLYPRFAGDPFEGEPIDGRRPLFHRSPDELENLRRAVEPQRAVVAAAAPPPSSTSARAPFQVLVFPFRRSAEGSTLFAVFQRADAGYWQAVAGGGEGGETPSEAARREALEEAGIPPSRPFYPLRTAASIPSVSFEGCSHWPENLYVIPEHAFAVECGAHELRLSTEHVEARWLDYESAHRALHWQTNQVALWELHERLARDDLPPPV